ncbi:molecular chaperone GrpE [Bacilli bacterium PM5-9]|nr:molecular chaperone GrpE [Bacilli bacterium PM5-9]
MSENKEEQVEEVKDSEQVAEVEQELSEVELLQKNISELEQKNKELDEKYLMAYADAQNIAKRAKIDAENLVVNKVSKLVDDILPALDNFERALGVDVKDESITNFLKGFEMIYQQLAMVLENEGVKQIESVGKEFDPNFHQSIAQVNDENYESNIVVEELQKGYTFRNKVIRPAMVKVNE